MNMERHGQDRSSALLQFTPEEEQSIHEKVLRRSETAEDESALLAYERNRVIGEKLFRRLEEKYHLTDLKPEERSMILYNTLGPALRDTVDQFGSFENIKGKRILDIACGSSTSQSELSSDPRLYEPWFCRALLELDADPVGIDIGDLSAEEFEHHNLDLSVSGALGIFPEKSFDGVHMEKLATSPRFESATTPEGREEVLDEIQMQIDRVLKKDGARINEIRWWE